MGGFSSKGGQANQQVQVQEVTVGTKKQLHQESAVASERPPVNEVSSKPRPDIVQRAPQSIGSSDHRQPSSGVNRVGAGDRSGQGVARPKNGPAHGSLRITSGDQNEDWGEVLADMPFGNAEEEEMQRAIEASIMESHTRAASVPIDRHNSHNISPQARNIAAGNQQNSDNAYGRKDDVEGDGSETPRRSAHPRGRQAGPAKAATSGLKGGGWVDNSDFHAAGSSNSRQGPGSARCRSVPATTSTRSGMPVGGSGIVTLPRIAQPVPACQQEMVKELHEKIKGTMAGDEIEGAPAQQKNQKHSARGIDHEIERVNGHNRPKGGVDVQSLMEDNNLEDISLSQINGTRRNQEKFNDQFHSCGGGSGRGGAQSSGFR
eukprot:gnl/MRDRNA2_/MRDRNA2_38378_c0_seq1.p1 gnl/MRDRNA2_/MRDRNA2_38378_c0~~gnl/MRDRNA2_/MRDRNA2_38378_c0_seq1.p1  ORF type:complete len:375 (+),score=67.97 gnl/MRDRNA2_/MRDRNA2_38378_c0_seq1:183-1307(+)